MDDDDDTEYKSVHKYDQRTIRCNVEDKGTSSGEDYGRSVILDYCAMIKGLMEEDISDLFKIKGGLRITHLASVNGCFLRMMLAFIVHS